MSNQIENVSDMASVASGTSKSLKNAVRMNKLRELHMKRVCLYQYFFCLICLIFFLFAYFNSE